LARLDSGLIDVRLESREEEIMTRTTSIATVALALAAGTAAAQEPAPAPFTLSGFVSLTATANGNDPPDGSNTLRVFDTTEGELSLDVVEIVLEQPVASLGDAGFRADLTAGSAIPHVTAARGLFRDPETGEAEDFDLQQLYVSWIAPVGRGLRLDVGKYTSPLGYEGIEGYDGWNDTVSRSFIFGYATAATHTGLRAALPFSDAVTGTVWIVAGWDVVDDNNDARTLGAQLALAPPGGAFSGSLTCFTGPEQDGDDEHRRDTADLILKLQASPALAVALDVISGSEELGGGADATWLAAALYARLQLGDAAAIALRLERFDDSDGARTGIVQVLTEATLAADITIARGLHFRPELRLDSSDQAVFPSSDGFETTQPTIALNVIWVGPDMLGR
jgi:hypothetical protein